MMNIRKFFQGLGIVPKSSSTADSAGEMEVLSGDNRLYYNDGISNKIVTLNDASDVFTNKTIDADLNTITNIDDGNIKTGAAINAAKLADGSVSNTEFQYINSVTSNVQDQLDAKLPGTLLENNIFVGDSSDVAAAVDTSAVGDILADETNGLNIKTGVIINADINASAAIDASKIANGSVSNTEFQYLDGVTSAIQTQLGTKFDTVGSFGASPTANGISVSSTTITLQPADGSNPGAVTTGAQTIAGAKTFSGGITATVTGTASGNTTIAPTNHGVVISGAGNAMTATSVGATGTVLKGNTGADPTFGAVVLTTDVSGILPAANVGLTRTINAQTGTTYTFVLGDGSAAGGNPLVTFGNSGATTVTVPPNSSVAFPVGSEINVIQVGTGKITLAQGAGVTINSEATNKAIAAQYVGATLVKTATDTWILLGHLIA